MLAKVLVGLLTLAGSGPLALAVNRCVTPSGQILYTDASCESLGAKYQREVKATISVLPPVPSDPVASRPNSPAAKGSKPVRKAFEKSPQSPVIVVCYDPKGARKDVSEYEIEATIKAAVSSWNAGCNVNYQFLGLCTDDGARDRRPIDYKVSWESWDDTLTVRDDPSKTYRDHAVAAAGPSTGIALNRDMEDFSRYFRFAIVHEFGHVVGIGHSSNPGDVMYAHSERTTPTESDLEACNKAIEERYGIKSVSRR